LRIKLNALPVDEIITFFTPYLFSLHDMEDMEGLYDENETFTFPKVVLIKKFLYLKKLKIVKIKKMVNLSFEKIENDGLYLMDEGQYLIMYISRKISPDLLY